jgi:hypothetical protein
VIQPGNIGYQLLVSVLNGLARDRKVNKRGLPVNWLVRGYLSVASGSNCSGDPIMVATIVKLAL